MALTAKDLLPTVKKLVFSYIKEIGSGDESQNQYLCTYISHALRELAGVANRFMISDELVDPEDGYVTFKVSEVAITDLYAPIRIVGPDGEVDRRTSYADLSGWWRDSGNSEIHVKNIPEGSYKLHYYAYPRTVTQADDVIDFPDSAVMGLSYYAAALVVESLPNAKDLAAHYYALANQRLKVAVHANVQAGGFVSGGFQPTVSVVDKVFKG